METGSEKEQQKGEEKKQKIAHIFGQLNKVFNNSFHNVLLKCLLDKAYKHACSE